MVGAEGNNLLIGGSGADTFAYDTGFGGNDTILGFSVGQDFVEIRDGMNGINLQTVPTAGGGFEEKIQGFDGLNNKIEVVGNSLKITIGDDTILIKGITGARTWNSPGQQPRRTSSRSASPLEPTAERLDKHCGNL